MGWDDGEPVDLPRTPGHVRVQRWRIGNAAHWRSRMVTVGTLPDGRWFVGHTKLGVRIFADETAARRVAQDLMTGEGWREIPANYDGHGNPLGPGPWRTVGNETFRDINAGKPE